MKLFYENIYDNISGSHAFCRFVDNEVQLTRPLGCSFMVLKLLQILLLLQTVFIF